MKFYGMSSRPHWTSTAGGRETTGPAKAGKSVVPHRGPVKETIQEITGGIRSACAYVGAARLKDLSKCTTFVICNRPSVGMFHDEIGH